ncbi:hypothetical protein IMY05_003G0034200 [Salix suchowensis]|nr:hypothetical protein IMY05_003G0034200 [Salix suchowensis]
MAIHQSHYIIESFENISATCLILLSSDLNQFKLTFFSVRVVSITFPDTALVMDDIP